MCTNPAVSMPDLDLVEKALRQAELVVVGMPTTRPTRRSLPTCCCRLPNGRKRRGDDQLRAHSHLPPRLVPPPGEALPDWQIMTQFAREMGLEEAFPFERAEEVFEEFKQLTKGRPMDITGVTYARLTGPPMQWPCPAFDHPGTPRLYTDRRFHTPDGRARFIPVGTCRPGRASLPRVSTLPDDGPGQEPMAYHDPHRQGGNLLKSCREPFVELHPQDARRHGVQDGDFVELTSRRESRGPGQGHRDDCLGHLLRAVPLGPEHGLL